MEETNPQSPVQNPVPAAPSQVVVGQKNYFWVAIAVILFGGVLLIGIFMLAYPQATSESTATTTPVATTSAQINSSSDLTKATQQLDNVDLTAIQNDLNKNDQAAASF